MLGNFFKNYGKVKAEQVGDSLVNLAATLDAEGVSEAAVKQKQEEHDEYVRQLVDAQRDFSREKKEFDDIEALYNKKLAAAERAQADLTTNPANSDAATALEELLNSVEKMAPRLDKERREYEDAEHLMIELQQASNEIATELKGLRETINSTNAAIKEAELDAERARKEREKAEKIAGLRKASGKFDVAMSALQKKAEEKQKEADVHRIAAEQLRKPIENVSSAASKYLNESDPETTETLQERLARLKAKA
jgi:chromosome segregation ATPase